MPQPLAVSPKETHAIPDSTTASVAAVKAGDLPAPLVLDVAHLRPEEIADRVLRDVAGLAGRRNDLQEESALASSSSTRTRWRPSLSTSGGRDSGRAYTSTPSRSG